MNKNSILLLLFLFVIGSRAQQISIIPQPVKMALTQGEFSFNDKTQVLIEPGDEMKSLADLLTSTIKNFSGLTLPVTTNSTGKLFNNLIQFETNQDFQNKEGYSLLIKPGLIKISAKNCSGIFYGLQSLFQMIDQNISGKKISLPSVNIEDYPRFKWRGVHLDVCRHFFPVEFVKKYIDMLSMYKMNTFHWHLTDDQGWRIEIKKYPKLTETAAWRTEEDGKTYGGFYTQDQVKEVVEYAKKHYITIVPEIEMPGHAVAALTAYPELSCTGGPFKVETHWGVFEDVFCAGNEKTFEFLQDVLSEVINLFPGEIIHIGGDEVPKIRWKACEKCQARIKTENLKDENELQSYFIQRIEKFLNAKGKKIIGWDEILEGGLAPNASVMSWRGIDGGIAAAKQKHFVVMTPGTHCYFDHYQALNNEPKAIGGYTSLEKVYSYEPVPEILNKEEASYILGAQANMWAEYISTTDHIEYMLMPRMIALSEVVWSPKELRNFDNFMNRLNIHYNFLASKNINFRIPSPLPDDSELLLFGNKELKLNNPIPNSKIIYTIDGSEPTNSSPNYSAPINLSESGLLKAKTILPGGKTSSVSSLTVSIIDTTHNGLNFKFYEGLWNRLPNFDSLSSKKSGRIFRLKLADVKPTVESFAVALSGYIKFANDGNYTFYISSDDGSKLIIDDKVIDNDGAHGIKEVTGQLNIKAGMHPIKILYFNKWGSSSLRLEYEGPGVSRRIVPASLLYISK